MVDILLNAILDKFKNLEAKEAAYILFQQGWSQGRIADAVKVTEKTVSNWKTKHNWDKKRTESAMSKESSEQKLWNLIAYQLDALERKKEEWIRDEEYKLIDKGDIDALSKMYSAVKGKQHTWAQIVEIITELVDFCQSKNFKLTKELIQLTDEFLMLKKEAMNG